MDLFQIIFWFNSGFNNEIKSIIQELLKSLIEQLNLNANKVNKQNYSNHQNIKKTILALLVPQTLLSLKCI